MTLVTLLIDGPCSSNRHCQCQVCFEALGHCKTPLNVTRCTSNAACTASQHCHQEMKFCSKSLTYWLHYSSKDALLAVKTHPCLINYYFFFLIVAGFLNASQGTLNHPRQTFNASLLNTYIYRKAFHHAIKLLEIYFSRFYDHSSQDSMAMWGIPQIILMQERFQRNTFYSILFKDIGALKDL